MVKKLRVVDVRRMSDERVQERIKCFGTFHASDDQCNTVCLVRDRCVVALACSLRSGETVAEAVERIPGISARSVEIALAVRPRLVSRLRRDGSVAYEARWDKKKVAEGHSPLEGLLCPHPEPPKEFREIERVERNLRRKNTDTLKRVRVDPKAFAPKRQVKRPPPGEVEEPSQLDVERARHKQFAKYAPAGSRVRRTFGAKIHVFDIHVDFVVYEGERYPSMFAAIHHVVTSLRFEVSDVEDFESILGSRRKTLGKWLGINWKSP